MRMQLPSKWENAPLSEVALIDRTSVRPENISTGTFYVGLEHIEGTGQFGDVQSVEAGELASNKFAFGESHVLYGKLRPYLRKIALPTFEGICSTDILPLLPGDRLDRRFLYYYLRQPKMVELATARCGGANLPRLSPKTLAEFPIPLPPLAEQKRIAAILDKADAIRRKRQEAIALTDEFLRSAFLDTFGDPRIANTDWPEVTLGEITLLDAPMVDPREEQHLDLLHIGPDRIERETGLLLPALTAREEGLISGKFLFDERYVLYSKIRPYLRKVALPGFTGLCSADVYPVRPIENKATREFLYSLLVSRAFLAYTESLPSRASIPKLNRKELARYTFRLPPLEMQETFSKLLERQAEMKSRSMLHTQSLNNLFNALVQRAFRGEL